MAAMAASKALDPVLQRGDGDILFLLSCASYTKIMVPILHDNGAIEIL